MNRIINLPQKARPLDSFAALDGVASYRIRLHVNFAVVHEVNARPVGLSADPGQVPLHHEFTAIPDQTACDAVMAADPGLSAIHPAFVVPPGTKVNLDLRSLAIGRALTDLRDEVRALGGPEQASDAQKRRAAQLAAGWRVLRTSEASVQAPRPTPAVNRA